MNTNESKHKRESVASRTAVFRQSGETEALTPAVAESEKNVYLRSFLQREEGSISSEGQSPPHISIMKQQELVDYEPASDVGHFRFYPKGTLMKNLLEDLAEDIAINRIGATRIETPSLYQNVGAVKEQAISFHESDYHLEADGRELILRFAGDFGLFNMVRDARVGEKQLPLRIYEISPSFRKENKGACTGLKRLRAFTMPDVHCFCKDLEQGMEEFASLHKFYDQFLNEAGLPFAIGFRTTEDFLGKNPEFIKQRLQDSKQDGLVEVLESMKHYWVLKNEFQYIDSGRDNVQLSTVQLDISDAERYGLTYKTPSGDKPFTIVHSSMGSIERIMGAIIEERAKEKARGEKPVFPYWLSPTQVRLIPVTQDYLGGCEGLADSLRGVRVDIDDREQSVGKRVRSAEKEWVPSYIVYGENEQASGRYVLKTRGKELRDKGLEGPVELGYVQSVLDSVQGNRPFRGSYLNRQVTKQLRFGSGY